MRVNLKTLIMAIMLSINSNQARATIIAETGLNLAPIATELYLMLVYAQNISTISPQLITILPEIQVINQGIGSSSTRKEIIAYTYLVIGLVAYLHYTGSLDLAPLASDISFMLTYAQYIAAIIPQITTTIEQLTLVDSKVTDTSTTEKQLAYISMVMGFLAYYSYIESPF